MIINSQPYPIWLNLVGYQCLWLLAVFTGNYSLVVLTLCLGAHFWFSPERPKEALMMIFCTTVGISIDSLLTVSGVYQFNPLPSLLPIPWWLLGIWIAFSATLRNGLRFFIARPPLALLSAAIGAPLAYLSAARLGAVEFPLGGVNTAIIIAVVWVPLMALLIAASRWLDSRPLS